jgi:ribose 1,5-bisphosphokinase
VTSTPTISGHRQAAIGPGRLVLVVGPSGAGKDTLLALAQAACAGQRDIVFPRRVVTREASSSEDNEQVSFEDFRQGVARGDFAVHWEAHGHCYGLPRAIDDDIRAGRTIVVNVSRTVVQAMRRAYDDVTVVAITAPSEILAARLAARARNSDGQLVDRLRRAVDGVAEVPDVTIDNVGNAEHHAGELVRIIKGG